MKAGTKGRVSVEISDDVSGVLAFHGRLVPESGASGPSVEFYGSVGTDFYYYFNWNNPENTTKVGDNTYSVEFDVSESLPSGVYRLEFFETFDKARNHTVFWAAPGSDTYSNSSLPIPKVEVIGKEEEVEISGGTDSFKP